MDVGVEALVSIFIGDALNVGIFVHNSHAFVVCLEIVFEVGLAGSQWNDCLREYLSGSCIFGRGGGSKMGVFIDSFFEFAPQFLGRFIDAVDVGGGGIIKCLCSRQCLLESTFVDLCCGRSGNNLHATDDESVPTVARRVDVQNVVCFHIHVEVEFVCQRTLHLLVGGFIEHSSGIQSCLRENMVLSVLGVNENGESHVVVLCSRIPVDRTDVEGVFPWLQVEWVVVVESVVQVASLVFACTDVETRIEVTSCLEVFQTDSSRVGRASLLGIVGTVAIAVHTLPSFRNTFADGALCGIPRIGTDERVENGFSSHFRNAKGIAETEWSCCHAALIYDIRNAQCVITIGHGCFGRELEGERVAHSCFLELECHTQVVVGKSGFGFLTIDGEVEDVFEWRIVVGKVERLILRRCRKDSCRGRSKDGDGFCHVLLLLVVVGCHHSQAVVASGWTNPHVGLRTLRVGFHQSVVNVELDFLDCTVDVCCFYSDGEGVERSEFA